MRSAFFYDVGYFVGLFLGPVFFGLWQWDWFAGLWMFCVVVLVKVLVHNILDPY